MPYRWTETPEHTALTLWPHQSMTASGFSWFIGVTAALLSLPLISVLGSPVVWVLLAFFLLTLAAVWRAIMANKKHRSMHEALTIKDEEVHLEHVPAKGPVLNWSANPHWVSVHLHDTGPVEKYLTLRGGGREVELGAFLTPEEREGLYNDLNQRLTARRLT